MTRYASNTEVASDRIIPITTGNLTAWSSAAMAAAAGRPGGSSVISRTYPDFLDRMGELLKQAMPRTDRERDEVEAADAEVRRLKSQLAVAEERQEVARERYERERSVFMEMFGTWKSEVVSLRSEPPLAAPDHICPACNGPHLIEIEPDDDASDSTSNVGLLP